MNERSYWLGFSNFSGIGPGRFGKLLKQFGSAKNAWSASFEELEKVLGKALTLKFDDFRNKFSIRGYEQKLKSRKVGYVTFIDKDYPILLKQIKKPPFVLYVKGKFDFNAEKNMSTIAIVGTRRITQYGKQVTEGIASDLAVNSFVIISGLALGVDATAHKTSIDNRGKTIAVLGCGVDCCYPRENQRLHDEILAMGGAIVSEYPLGVEPSKGSFPSRNRIVAGLSQGVLVTEGSADSGALYTADEAFALSRPVFAVPGPITSSLSKGPHGLISKGAKLISSAEEIISALGTKGITSITGTTGAKEQKSERVIKGATREERRIIEVLENENLYFDEIAKRTKIKSSKLGGILSIMEMKGIVTSLDSGVFSINNS